MKFLTDMGLFIGQSSAFFAFLNDLAEDADEASEADKKGTSTPAAVRFLSAAAFNCWRHTISLESPAEAYRVQSNNRN